MKKSLVFVVLSTAFLTTACQTETTTQPLIIGSLFPMTGDSSSFGKNLSQAVNLAVNTINACGGVNNSSVTLVQEDTKTDSSAGAAAMSKLVSVDQVAGVVGPWSSGVSAVTIKIAVNNEVMQISSGSTSPIFTERAQAGEFDGFWARTVPSDVDQAKALAEIANKESLDRVATVVINNDYGVGLEQAFIQSFQAVGGTTINEDNPVRYDPNPNTLDSEVAAVFADNPDAVLGVLYEDTGSLLLRSAHEQGFGENVTFLLTDGVYSERFIEAVGTDSQGESILKGALGTVPGANGAGLDDLTEQWEETIGSPVTAFVPHTWDAAILMMLAAELADENTGTAIKNNLREVSNAPGEMVSDPCEAMQLIREGTQINYQGASGDLELDQFGDTTGTYDVWQVRENGEMQIIDQIILARD